MIIWLAKSYLEVIEMRTSILSILIALTVVIAGPLAFAAQETESLETLSETAEVTEVS